MNYSAIKAKFLLRLNRRDCTDALADSFLQDGITRIQRTLRIPAMERSLLITLDSTYASDGGVVIPDDYVKLQDLTMNGKRVLKKESLSMVVALAADQVSDNPWCYARQGGLWVLAPAPIISDAGPVVRVDYFAEFPDQVNPSDDTVLTDIASDLLLYAALSYAADHYTDKRGGTFEGRFKQIEDDIQGQADDDELAGGAVVQSAYSFPDEDGVCR